VNQEHALLHSRALSREHTLVSLLASVSSPEAGMPRPTCPTLHIGCGSLPASICNDSYTSSVHFTFHGGMGRNYRACLWNGTHCNSGQGCDPSDNAHYTNGTAAHLQHCLRSSLPCAGTICDAHYPHSCLAASIPFWSARMERVRCCMGCCVRYWMRVLGLGHTERQWSLQSIGHRSRRRRRQLRRRRLRRLGAIGSDWAPSQLLTHANGEVLLNEMAMALLAHGNMIEAREGSARPQLIDSLAVLLRRPLLLLHSIGSATPLDWSADADVSLALSRPNRNKTVPVPALVLISRGDVQIPTAGSLESWRRLRSEWQRAGAPAPRWFVQNVAGGVATTLAPDNGIRPLPTGVQDPEELLTFLKYAPNGLEGRVSHRSTLLMCCCMQTETMERQRAVKALRRNGFACNSSDVRTEATLRAAPEKRFGQQYTVEHDATERRFHMWRYRYYSAMLHSRFVASPEGHGRDTPAHGRRSRSEPSPCCAARLARPSTCVSSRRCPSCGSTSGSS
jgi:hypothetical protein